MNITDIKIRKLMTEGRLKAIVSITLDNELALHDIKIIEGPSRLFVAMPSRRDDNGVFRDIVHPISAEGRAAIESGILDYYSEYLVANEINSGNDLHSPGRTPNFSQAEYHPLHTAKGYPPYHHQATHEQ